MDFLLKKLVGSKNNVRRLILLRAVYTEPKLSRSEYCQKTGISKNHITVLVRELLAEKILIECERTKSPGSGRPSVALDFNPELFFTLGISTSAESPEIVLLNAARQVVERLPLLQHGKTTAFLLELRQKSSYLLRKYSEKQILAAGIAVPGIVDSSGVVKYSSAFGPGKIELKKFFKEELNLDITIINPSHTLPLMEKFFGSARDLETFVTVDEGLGCGMFLQGKLYRGWQNAGGELGYMKITDTSVVNGDGRNGVLMDMSLFGLVGDRALSVIRQGGKVNVEWTGKKNEYIPPKAIVKAVESGSGFIARQLTEIFEHIGDAVVNLAYLLNPQVIFWPEWTGRVKECTLDVVRQKLQHYGRPEWELETQVLPMTCPRKRMPEAVAVFAGSQIFDKISNSK
jgi:predicted NBD/HSP70 family sugar kinase